MCGIGFGDLLIGAIGYGFGLLVLVGSIATVSDYKMALRRGSSADGWSAEKNLACIVLGLAVSFVCFVVTRALL